MKERTLEFYLNEEGPYKQTVYQVINPYLDTLDYSIDLFHQIDDDLSGLKSQLYIDLDSLDKRIKSCFMAGYLALDNYYKTLDEELKHPEEKAHVEKLLKLFEHDIMLDKSELISSMRQIVDEVQNELNEWVRLRLLQGNYEKAQKVIITTYISLRALWIKLSKDWKVRAFVHNDVKESLKTSQKILKGSYAYWHKRKQQEEKQRLEAELIREANSGLNDQIELAIGRLKLQLLSEKEAAPSKYAEDSELAEFIYPLAKSLSDYNSMGELKDLLCKNYRNHQSQARLLHFLNLSEPDHVKLEALLNPTTSLLDYINPFSLDTHIELYSILKTALEKAVCAHFNSISQGVYVTSFEISQFLASYQDKTFLEKQLEKFRVREQLLDLVKEMLNAQVASLSSLEIKAREPMLFDALEDNQVTESIQRSITNSRVELQEALKDVTNKLELFDAWSARWQRFDELSLKLDPYERDNVKSIATRVIDDLSQNVLDEGKTAPPNKLCACREAYRQLGHSINRELESVNDLITFLNRASAEKALKALQDFVNEKKHSLWHKLLYRLCPTYHACFKAIKEGIQDSTQDEPDAYVILGRIQDNIRLSLSHCSWSLVKKISSQPLVKAMKPFSFFEEENSKPVGERDEAYQLRS